MSDRAWHETADNVTNLGAWLFHQCGFFADGWDMLAYFEKPWKWTAEYEAMQRWIREPGIDQREQIVDEIMNPSIIGDPFADDAVVHESGVIIQEAE